MHLEVPAAKCATRMVVRCDVDLPLSPRVSRRPSECYLTTIWAERNSEGSFGTLVIRRNFLMHGVLPNCRAFRSKFQVSVDLSVQEP